MDKQLLTTEEVALLLQVGSRTVTKWAEEGAIPAHKVGGTWRIERTELPQGRLYTYREAAKLFSVHVKTLDNWMKRGYITPDDLYQIGEKFVRIKEECVNAIANGRRVYPDPRKKEALA